jgi:ABC-type uncharacterized transport system permease subunit
MNSSIALIQTKLLNGNHFGFAFLLTLGKGIVNFFINEIYNFILMEKMHNVLFPFPVPEKGSK